MVQKKKEGLMGAGKKLTKPIELLPTVATTRDLGNVAESLAKLAEVVEVLALMHQNTSSPNTVVDGARHQARCVIMFVSRLLSGEDVSYEMIDERQECDYPLCTMCHKLDQIEKE